MEPKSTKIHFIGKKELNQKQTKKFHEIHVASFSAFDASLISAVLSLSLQLNIFYVINHINGSQAKLQQVVIKAYKENPETLEKWLRSIALIKDSLDKEFLNYLPNSEGEIIQVNNESPYIQDFKDLLLELKPIKIVPNKSEQTEFDDGEVENLISEIKTEVKKGNRATFKLMQELQEKLEELAGFASAEEEELIKQQIQDYEKKANGFVHVALKAVDSMDLIYQTALKAELTEWAEQIHKIIDNFILELDSLGIEEIKAIGEFIEGETMISIGTVPPESNPELEKYQVYAVHERGFKFKDTGKVIREAKVTTIY